MILLKNDEVIDFLTWTPTNFSVLKNFQAKNAIQFLKTGYNIIADNVTVTLWKTVIYFINKLSIDYRSFKAIAGCPLGSS